jgi:hypothetical protein
MNESILQLLDQIRGYDKTSIELQTSHHFTFCLPCGKKGSLNKVLLMGFNPGETAHDWKKTNGERAEESCAHNFNSYDQSPSSKKWYSNIDFYLPNSEVLFTEFIFWSSSSINTLEKRIGKINAANPHVRFCIRINKALIAVYEPRVIVFTGLSHMHIIAKNFDLSNVKDIFSKSGTRIAIEAESNKQKWIFCRHWTGSFGFSTLDKFELKEHISNLLS